jgi:imidazoleglycerol-phosphate dehydratase
VKSQFKRKTKETVVKVTLGELSAPGLSRVAVSTGLPFYDHMSTTLLKYAGIEADIEATGDLNHHIMEDVAIVLGEAIRARMPAEAARYGERTIPMDDALVQAAIDVGGRFYFEGKLPSKLYTHVLRSLSGAMLATLHVRVLRGSDRHHVIEAAFKATGLALRQALGASAGGVFSTKGVPQLEREEVS